MKNVGKLRVFGVINNKQDYRTDSKSEASPSAGAFSSRVTGCSHPKPYSASSSIEARLRINVFLFVSPPVVAVMIVFWALFLIAEDLC